MAHIVTRKLPSLVKLYVTPYNNVVPNKFSSHLNVL